MTSATSCVRPGSIAVICTARNAEQTIGDVINSVLVQSYASWSMIVVDDASTDSTREIVEEICQSDSRVRMLALDNHSGRAAALNHALRACQAEWIINVDADDPMHPHRISHQYNYSLVTEPCVGVVATASIYIAGTDIPAWDLCPVTDNIPVKDVTHLLLKRNVINHSSVLMRKTMLDELGGYDESLASNVDYDLWLRVVKNGYRIHTLDARLSSKRLHEGQSFERRNRVRYLTLSSRVQMKHLWSMRKEIAPSLFMYPLYRLLYGLLPALFRHWIGRRR